MTLERVKLRIEKILTNITVAERAAAGSAEKKKICNLIATELETAAMEARSIDGFQTQVVPGPRPSSRH